MRNVLGYPVNDNYTYDTNYITEENAYLPQYRNNTKEIEDLYPELHKKISPIISNVCNRYSMPITRDMLEDMVEEVFSHMDGNRELDVKINVENRESIQKNEVKSNIVRNPIVQKTNTNMMRTTRRSRR